jgi:hypothetical protein
MNFPLNNAYLQLTQSFPLFPTDNGPKWSTVVVRRCAPRIWQKESISGKLFRQHLHIRNSLFINNVTAMTVLFALSCFAIAFSPAFMIFLQIVTKDPLRVILFFLG